MTGGFKPLATAWMPLAQSGCNFDHGERQGGSAHSAPQKSQPVSCSVSCPPCHRFLCLPPRTMRATLRTQAGMGPAMHRKRLLEKVSEPPILLKSLSTLPMRAVWAE